MRVLHISAPTQTVGGGDTILINLLSEKRSGIDEQIATIYYSEFFSDAMNKLGVPIHVLKKTKIFANKGTRFWEMTRVLSNFLCGFKLMRIMREKEIDLVHVHGFSAATVFLLPKLLGGKFKSVYTHHGFRRRPKKAEEIILTRLYNRFDIKTGVSETAAQSLNDAFPTVRERFICVYNCINSRFFDSEGGGGFFDDIKASGRRIFIQSARFSSGKNQIDVVKALNKLDKETLGRIYVVFLGDGPNLDDVKQYAADHGLTDCVRFIGAVPPDEVPGYMRCCDFGLFPTEIEGFGLGAVECMAFGLPVLALDNELMREIVQDTGILVEKEDIDKGIVKMLQTGDELRDKAYKRAREFTPKAIKDRYVELYESLMA